MRRRLGLLICIIGSAAVDGADLRPKPQFVPNISQSQGTKIQKQKYESIEANIEPSSLHDKPDGDNMDSIESTERSPSNISKQHRWAQITDLDRQIFATTLPLSAIFAIIPLASAISLFWVNRLGSTLSVAGQAAANQVYSSAFWLFSFLPSVTATLVSKTHANGDLQGTQDAVCQAFLFAMIISMAGASFMFFFPDKALASILKADSPALEIARPYLRIRAFSFAPMLISFVGFSAFRGTMDVQTSVKVTLGANLFTMLLEPTLLHVLKIGIRGAALSTLCGEIVSASVYLKLLTKRRFLAWKNVFRIHSWASVAPLVKGGISLQLRSFCMNFTFLMVARVIQSLDDTGVSASAHALAAQTFQLGGIVLGALGMASQTMVPKALAATTTNEDGSLSPSNEAKPLIRRLLMWGSSLGFLIGMVQLAFLPAILKSSPVAEVREAARVPALIAIAFQGVNGIVSVGEGIMMGSGHFTWLSINIVLAALGYLATLRIFPKLLGLTGVWICLSCFTSIRLVGVLVHLFIRSPKQERARNKLS